MFQKIISHSWNKSTLKFFPIFPEKSHNFLLKNGRLLYALKAACLTAIDAGIAGQSQSPNQWRDRIESMTAFAGT